MGNSFTYAKRYAEELDKKLVQDAVTGIFADNVLQAKFVGANTVIIPDMELVGLGDYSRTDGFPEGKATITQTAYTLSNDRGREFEIDRADHDETGVIQLAGEMCKAIVHDYAAPEMDAYGLSKLYAVAEDQEHTESYSTSAPYGQLISLINAVGNETGFDEELVAFVDSTAYAALRTTNEFSHAVDIADFVKGEISTRVKKIDNTMIVPVSSARMKTLYDFSAGATSAVGGFEPDEDADSIRMMVLPVKGASLIKKHETLRMFAPDVYQKKDAYLVQYRLYYDMFVKKSRLGHIYAAIA